MEEKIGTIRDLSIEEREEILVDMARLLEGTAREAFVEGDRQFATISSNMANAIRFNADELARDDLDASQQVLEQAAAMLSEFQAAHPYRPVSMAIH